MLISIDAFQGMMPAVEPHLLEPYMAKEATNVNLLKGSLRPWKKELIDTTLSQSDVLIKTIYQYLETYWFEFSAEVHILPGPIANDTTHRRYFSGIGVAKKTNQAEATTGSPPYPVNFYPIQTPIPHAACTAALGAGGTGDPRSIGYEWTSVTSWGEEGPASPASNLVSAMQGQTVNLSGISIEWAASQNYEVGTYVIPVGGVVDHVYMCVVAGVSGTGEPTWGTTVDGDTTDNTVTWRAYKKALLYDTGATKRVYRILTGDAFGSYRYIGAVAMATTTYIDTKTDTEAAGGVIIPSSTWYGPPIGMQGLTVYGRVCRQNSVFLRAGLPARLSAGILFSDRLSHRGHGRPGQYPGYRDRAKPVYHPGQPPCSIIAHPVCRLSSLRVLSRFGGLRGRNSISIKRRALFRLGRIWPCDY